MANLFRTGLVFLRSIVVARGLGAELYGTYAIVVAFVETVQQFFNFNVPTSLIKFGAAFRTRNRTDQLVALLKAGAFVSLISAVASVFIIAILITFSYDTFIEQDGLYWFIVFYAMVACVFLFDNLSTALLRIFDKFKFNSLVQIVMAVVEFSIIAFTIYLYPRNLTYFFVAVIAAKLLNSLIINGMAMWELRAELLPYAKSKMALISAERKEMTQFTFGNSVGQSVITIMNKGDVLLLAALAGPAAVGLYAVAKKLAFSILIITDPLKYTIFPQLSSLISKGKYRDIKKMLFRITGVSLLPSLVFLVGMFYLNEWIITLFYGDEYAGASASFFYLFMAATMASVFFWNLSMIQSLGIIKFRFYVYAVAIAAGGGLAWYLIPAMGAEGAAIGHLVLKMIIIIAFTGLTYKRLNSLQSEIGNELK